MKQLICDICMSEIKGAQVDITILIPTSSYNDCISMDICENCLKDKPDAIWQKYDTRLKHEREEIERACSHFV